MNTIELTPLIDGKNSNEINGIDLINGSYLMNTRTEHIQTGYSGSKQLRSKPI
ncbi:hypothetical protein [Methanolobus sp. WCC4]|uniref:hypothetical protein n=1 Tax=Methanolobus sp. WCC4 TaxID=3125784 RepID=UPI0030F625F0